MITKALASVVKCLPVVPSLHGEMDITTGFEPVIGSSNLSGGTYEAGGDIIMGFQPVVEGSNSAGGTNIAVKSNKEMKKLFLFVVLVCMLLPLFPGAAHAVMEELGGWVPCGRGITMAGTVAVPCQPIHLFIMLQRVYRDLIIIFAIPLAAVLVVAGGVTWIVSAGNPAMLSFGKRLFKGAAFGLALCLLSWLIVDVVLRSIGYTASWFQISF